MPEWFAEIPQYLNSGFLAVAVTVLAAVVRVLYKRNQDLSNERTELMREFQQKLEVVTTRELDAAVSYAEKNREIANNTTKLVETIIKNNSDG